MATEKIDNQLNLALDVTEQQRSRTADLNTGYDAINNTWELIVKYSGDIQSIKEELDFTVVELMGGYAIITIKQYLIQQLATYPQIEYIEMPKGLFFAVSDGRSESCINQVQVGANGLLGSGVLVAVIDSGIDYSHPDFRNEDGTTRIVELWDQTVTPVAPLGPPPGYNIGTLYTRERINEALNASSLQGMQEIVTSVDFTGHGTHVTGIVAGNGRASNERFRGVAPECELLIVKLGSSISESFPKTTQLMEAINYCIQKAMELGKPLAINISFGNNYGAHGNNSILERYINDVSNIWRSVICIGSGNEGASGHHYGGNLTAKENLTIEMTVAEREKTVNLQLWKNFYDDFDIVIYAPSGTESGTITKVAGKQTFVLEGTELLIYYGEPTPYSSKQEIYIEAIPVLGNEYLTSGVWKLELRPKRIVTGTFNMWFPTAEILNPLTRFLRPTLESTLTIPSTSSSSITVGAYDGATDSLAYFSGRGYTTSGGIKPDIVAPGVNIVSTSTGGSYTTKTGTSMATPFVTGSAALLMEWGIIRGFDPYLYGEKVKAYLIAGARKLPFADEYPNPEVGFGALCLRDTFAWIGVKF